MKKRIISLLLAAVLAFGLGAPAYASEGNANAEVDTSEMTVEGTNDVGALLANELQGKTVSGAGDNHISGLTVEDSVATVELMTDRAGEAVVAVYDEESGQMLASGNAPVAAGTETVSVTIEGTVPQYFVVTAFLLDAAGHEPLCEEYTTNLYTKEMQDFLDTDVNDYEPDRVLNLDGDPSTNFMVYSESTIVVKENGMTNVLTDNGDGTYTVTNADEPFTSLSAGDTFSYEQNDGNVKLVKVASVSVDGTTVLVTEDENVDMEDVFDYVKIEVGDGTDDDPSGVEAIAFEGEGSATVSTISVSYNNSGIKISGSLKTKLGVKIYLSWNWKYIELKATSTLSGSLEVTEKLFDDEEGKIPIGSAGFTPVAGLYVGFEFNFVIKCNISLKSNFTLKKTYTLTWEDGTFQKDTSEPKIEFELNIEGSLFIGLSIEAHLNLISDKILKLSVEVEIGGEIKATLAVYEPDKTSERHTCSKCVDGDINAKVEITCSVRVFNSDKWTAKATICSISIKIGDFYYSNDYGEYGRGTCPHISYRITLTVVDEHEQPVFGALVDGTGLEEAPVTSEEGIAEFYLPNGTYEVTVSLNGNESKKTIEVKDMPREITVVLSGGIGPTATPEPTPDVSEPSPTPDATPAPDLGEIVASGNCGANGDNVKWAYNTDRVLTIYGEGDMADYASYSDVPWFELGLYEELRKAVICEGVTNIGKHAFDRCDSMDTIVIPDSVTSIGELAFHNCICLTEVVIPDGAISIGEGAFYTCRGLIRVEIPDSVTSIGAEAFDGCESLTDVKIPNSVTSINDHTFRFCSSLTSVIIPDSVTSIGAEAFRQCESLTSVIIPNGVASIGEYAFEGCVNLTSVVIPNNLTSISRYTFRSCGGLISVTIPDSVTSINAEAFYHCDSLTDVYYGGTETQWAEIQMGAYNDCLTSAHIYYNSTGLNVLTSEESNESEATTLPRLKMVSEPESTPEPTQEHIEDSMATPTPTEEPAETPGPTVEPSASPEPTATPEPTAAPEPAEITPQQASQEENDGNVVLVSAFDGISDGQTALFTDLIPGEDYAVVVAVDISAAKLLSASNLLYIAQVAANDNGAIALAYIPRADSAASVRAFGPSCDHVWNEGEVTVDASCTIHGEKTYTCTICGLKKTEPVDALGHLKPEDESLIETTEEATCTEQGEITYTCERCHEEVTEEVPALGHAWDEGKVTKEPTAADKGVKIYTCTRCGETRTEEMPTKAPAPAVTDKPANTGSSVPQTGDDTPLAPYAGLLALCLGVLTLCLTRRRTNRKQHQR